MRWFKRDMWKVCIAIASLLVLLIFTVLIPLSASAHEGASRLATPTAGTVQATPTVDATMTALNKEKLAQEVQQLKNQNGNQNNWLADNSTALIAAAATVIVAMFGISQWAINRRDERQRATDAQDKELNDRQAAHDKDLRAQAEERFKAAITALGSDNEATQVGGAILLRSFLNKEDEEIYGRYYIQIFDLAVAYLRPSNTLQLSEDLHTSLPLTPLRQALIVVLKEVFLLARPRLGQIKSAYDTRSLDASHVRLDSAFLIQSDLRYIWMIDASIINARFSSANLYRADLRRAILCRTTLTRVNLAKANLTQADLSESDLSDANLTGAYLRGVKFNGAILTRTNLSKTNFRAATFAGEGMPAANPEDALSLKGADLRGVKGLTKEQLVACKAKGAIIDEDATTSSSQPPIATQSTNAQTPSTQGSLPTPDTNGSSASVSQQSNAAQTPAVAPTQVNTPPAGTDGSSPASPQQGSGSSG